jgi:hypothetical protein
MHEATPFHFKIDLEEVEFIISVKFETGSSEVVRMKVR